MELTVLQERDEAGHHMHPVDQKRGSLLTFLRAVASSFLVKFATARVDSVLSFLRAYSRVLARMNSEKCTRSPGSPAQHQSFLQVPVL